MSAGAEGQVTGSTTTQQRGRGASEDPTAEDNQSPWVAVVSHVARESEATVEAHALGSRAMRCGVSG